MIPEWAQCDAPPSHRLRANRSLPLKSAREADTTSILFRALVTFNSLERNSESYVV
jgi:hypothetical protein